MAIDLAALRAKLAAQKAATSPSQPVQVNTNAQLPTSTTSSNSGQSMSVASNSDSSIRNQGIVASSNDVAIPTVAAPDQLGTSKTTEIEHLDFLSKMNTLSEAIHKQHPTMPVLLMQIHKQLRTDPELVTTLGDDAIGIIVKGLQVQTKTELVAEAVKKTTSGRTKKNPALSTDMF